MRRAKPAIAMKSSGYHRFAWGTLGLAVLVAVSGNEGALAGDGLAAPQAMAQLSGSKPRLIHAPATSYAATADLADLSQNPDTANAEPDDELPAVTQIAEREPPSLPGERPLARKPASATGSVKPDFGQIDRMIAGSRARSGGVDQGDELRPGA